MRIAVLLSGTLRGHEREAPCEVLATRHVDRAKGPDTYSDLRFLKTPKDWPDGEYIADLDGVCAHARCVRGVWTVEADSELRQEDCQEINDVVNE